MQMNRPLPKTEGGGGGRGRRWGGGGGANRPSQHNIFDSEKLGHIFFELLMGFEIGSLISHTHSDRILSPKGYQLIHLVTPKAQLQGNPRKILLKYTFNRA